MSVPTTLTSVRRHIALALAIPSIVTALAVTGVEFWRILAPTRAEVGHRVYGTLGEAIVADDLRGVMGFVQSAQSPNALIAVHDPALTGGRDVLVPPIVWAAAAGRQRIVLALLGAGATFERDADKAAACIADDLDLTEIASQLRLIARLPAASSCPPPPEGPPLLAVGYPVAEPAAR